MYTRSLSCSTIALSLLWLALPLEAQSTSITALTLFQTDAGGTVIISHQHWPPTSTVFSTARYPSDEEILSAYKRLTDKVLLVDAVGIADQLNNRRVANSVLIGALSSVMDVAPEDWLSVLTARVPARHKEVNREAFFAGRNGQWLLKG